MSLRLSGLRIQTEDTPHPDHLLYCLRNYAALGIVQKSKAILFDKDKKSLYSLKNNVNTKKEGYTDNFLSSVYPLYWVYS